MFAVNKNHGAIAQGWGKKKLFKNKPRWKVLYIPAAMIASMIIIFILANMAGIRFNITESMPVGFYRAIDGEVQVGSVVSFCPPVDQKYDFMPAGSCSHGEAPYLKQVVALPGDVVTVSNSEVRVNGEILNGSANAGRSDLPSATGIWHLGPDEVWVYGVTNPQHSFDSRYFGPVKISTTTLVAPY